LQWELILGILLKIFTSYRFIIGTVLKVNMDLYSTSS